MSKACDCHGPKVEETLNKRPRNKLIAACVLSVLFIIAEVVGGYLANSLAIAADATHLFADLASFLIGLLALSLASRPPTKTFSFGWYRAEILGAMVSINLLWMITCVLCYIAIERIVQRDFKVDATIMLITATIGVVFNVIMMLTLHPGGHHHGDKEIDIEKNDNESINSIQSVNNDDEQLTLADAIHLGEVKDYGGVSDENSAQNLNESTSKKAKPSNHGHSHGGNINVLASFLHVLGDLIQSIGVLIAAVVIYFKPEYKLADPICTFLFSVIVIITTIPVMKDLILVLMEGAPKHLDLYSIHECFKSIPEVKYVHDLRLWSLSTDRVLVSGHIVIDKDTDSIAVLREASGIVMSRFGITETNLQIEEYHEDMDDCKGCSELSPQSK